MCVLVVVNPLFVAERTHADTLYTIFFYFKKDFAITIDLNRILIYSLSHLSIEEEKKIGKAVCG